MGADLDNSGQLDRAELQKVFRQLKLGLSQAQLEQLTAECDTDGDGLFDYREFLPLMQQMIADVLRVAQRPWNASAWHIKAGEPTVRAPRGRLGTLHVLHSEYALYGGFVWERRALNGPFKWFSARGSRGRTVSSRRWGSRCCWRSYRCTSGSTRSASDRWRRGCAVRARSGG